MKKKKTYTITQLNKMMMRDDLSLCSSTSATAMSRCSILPWSKRTNGAGCVENMSRSLPLKILRSMSPSLTERSIFIAATPAPR